MMSSFLYFICHDIWSVAVCESVSVNIYKHCESPVVVLASIYFDRS
jgi:hypothetical protein